MQQLTHDAFSKKHVTLCDGPEEFSLNMSKPVDDWPRDAFEEDGAAGIVFLSNLFNANFSPCWN